MKQTYEQRVKALADKLYTTPLGNHARVAVAEMAETAKAAYYEGMSVKSGDVEGYLKEQGLIPDNEPDVLPVLQPCEPGAGVHNPDNPEPDSLYKQNVRAIAEEMRQAVTPDKPRSAGDYMRGIIAVKKMAQAASDAYIAVENGHCIGAGTYLKQHGLIPDNGQEAGNDGNH